MPGPWLGKGGVARNEKRLNSQLRRSFRRTIVGQQPVHSVVRQLNAPLGLTLKGHGLRMPDSYSQAKQQLFTALSDPPIMTLRCYGVFWTLPDLCLRGERADAWASPSIRWFLTAKRCFHGNLGYYIRFVLL